MILRRILLIVLFLVSLVLFWILSAQSGAVWEHQLYFTQPRENVSFQLSELSEAWTEKTLRERFVAGGLHCIPTPGDDLGDTWCKLDTKTFNGIPTLFISFFFGAGHLRQVSINIPWWKHRTAQNFLFMVLGRQTDAQLLPRSGIRLDGWNLPNGAAIFYNRDISLNPLEWNTIFWRSASLCAAEGCFLPRAK